MSNLETLELSGIRESTKALYEFSQKLGDKVVVDALKEGAKITLTVIRATAPVYKGKPRKDVIKGTLKRGFSLKNSKIHAARKNTGLVGVYISLKKPKKTGAGRNPKDPFYGKFIEYGWKTGRLKFKAGKGFVKRSFATTQTRAARQVQASVVTGANIIKKKIRGLN